MAAERGVATLLAWARRLTAAGAAATALVAVAPGDAAAACTASTAASVSLADNASDAERGLAPEIAFVDASLGSACDLVVLPTLGDRSATGGLIRDETMATYIDTDGDPATGSPRWGGADRVVLVLGRRGPDLPPLLGTWTGAAFSFAAGTTLLVVAAGGFAATLDQLGVAGPTTLGLRVASTWTGLRDTYDDLAPKRAGPALAFAVTFTTDGGGPAAPAPAATPRPAPCLVPALRRLPVARARPLLARAGCRARVVPVASALKPGRVSTTLPAAGTWTLRTVVVNVARG
jgi:hypothetical protein